MKIIFMLYQRLIPLLIFKLFELEFRDYFYLWYYKDTNFMGRFDIIVQNKNKILILNEKFSRIFA